MLLPLPSRPANDTAHGRRGDVSRWSRLRRAFCGLLQGRRGDACRWARLRRLPPRVFPMPPRRCFPLGSSEAAFCGVLQSRRGDASRWARLRRLSAGFCGVAETMLPVGLVRGGLLRGFAGPPRRCFPMGSSEAASHGIFQRRHCAQRRRSLLSFSPPPPGERMPRARSRPCEPAGSPFPFPHFPTARPYFFLYPAARHRMPRATFPASICPAGRQGQRHFLCRLHGRRSSALPFRPIGGAPGTAPLFLHPAARGTDAAHGRPIHPDRQDNPSSLSHASGRRARPCEPAGSPFYFHSFPRASRASGRRPRTAHSPCSCARLLLFAAAPAASLLRFPPRFAFRAAHSCARVPSAPVSSVPRCLVPRRRALYPALFLRGRTYRAVLSPFPTRAARLSCPALPVGPACAHRVEAGKAVKPAAARSCAPGLCARRARPGHPCRRAHPGRPCRCSPPFASVRIPPCSRFPFFSIARQESERERRILYEHMFV